MALAAPVTLPLKPDKIAPDGSEVRELSVGGEGGMAHFTLPPGQTSSAVRHKTVEEIWYVVEGQGEIWRCDDGGDRVDDLAPGVTIVIPVTASFQFRNNGDGPLKIVGATMPPWPNDQEAVLVPDFWTKSKT
jgi:mannose-6-phosphate isomerase-like protein (cupin superfamily)